MASLLTKFAESLRMNLCEKTHCHRQQQQPPIGWNSVRTGTERNGTNEQIKRQQQQNSHSQFLIVPETT